MCLWGHGGDSAVIRHHVKESIHCCFLFGCTNIIFLSYSWLWNSFDLRLCNFLWLALPMTPCREVYHGCFCAVNLPFLVSRSVYVMQEFSFSIFGIKSHRCHGAIWERLYAAWSAWVACIRYLCNLHERSVIIHCWPKNKRDLISTKLFSFFLPRIICIYSLKPSILFYEHLESK